jgi:nicotinamidase-related amidase
MAAATTVAGLRQRADDLGVPVIYVNDNYGQWHSEHSRIIDYCSRATPAGRELSQIIAPRKDDYFVIKPRFSGFYATNLPVLLPKLGVQRLVMTGIAADICVLFTAADAHMRAYDLWVPADGVAGERQDHTDWALQIMARSMQAETSPTTALTLDAWLQRADRPG